MQLAVVWRGHACVAILQYKRETQKPSPVLICCAPFEAFCSRVLVTTNEQITSLLLAQSVVPLLRHLLVFLKVPWVLRPLCLDPWSYVPYVLRPLRLEALALASFYLRRSVRLCS